MTGKMDQRSPSQSLADLPATLTLGLVQSVAQPGTTDEAIRDNVTEIFQRLRGCCD